MSQESNECEYMDITSDSDKFCEQENCVTHKPCISCGTACAPEVLVCCECCYAKLQVNNAADIGRIRRLCKRLIYWVWCLEPELLDAGYDASNRSNLED